MKALVIYHDHCLDGFGAALAAWSHFGSDAEYVSANYGDCVISNGSIQIKDKTYPITGRRVVILDFSIPPSEMQILLQTAEFVTWIDHHKTAIDNWIGPQKSGFRYTSDGYKDNPCKVILDSDHSGAYLAWEYFHLTVPRLMLHVEDRDLWKWKMPGTAEICEGLWVIPRDFDTWDDIIDNSVELDKLEGNGAWLLMAKNERVKQAVERDLREVTLLHDHGNDVLCYKGLAANVVNDISETGNAIAKKSGTFSLTFFVQGDDAICSLRSIGDYDVSVIAKEYGGGGHKNAAGFKMPVLKFFEEVWS